MGLLRDAISSATGANKPNNGLGGPSLPWTRTSSPKRYDDYGSQSYNNQSINGTNYNNQGYSNQSYYGQSNSQGYINQDYDNQPGYNTNWGNQDPPPYDGYMSQGTRDNFASNSPSRGQRYAGASNNSFQPFGLPQIAHGDGQPFLRGYSGHLAQYDISETEFIRIVDAINVAIIPNPENQIFQKGASIAGWFVPGAASIGLIAGQVGVGLGTAYGHASALSRTLSKANLEMFLPRGLEICIMKNQTLDSFFGLSPSNKMPGLSPAGATPEERLAVYRGLLAPPSLVLPPAERSGRNDPIALLGRGIASRDAQKKVEKAQEKAREGKFDDKDMAGAEVKWLVVRPASPEALQYLRKEREGGQRRENSQTQEYGRRPDSSKTQGYTKSARRSSGKRRTGL